MASVSPRLIAKILSGLVTIGPQGGVSTISQVTYGSMINA
jgi:hypothetical protein